MSQSNRRPFKSFRKNKFDHRSRSRPPSRPPGSRHGARPEDRAGEPAWVEGYFQHKGTFGFVLSEDPKLGDVMVQGPSLRLAMDGDRVRARVKSASRSEDGGKAARRSGDITAVLQRARETAVGTFKRHGNMAVVAIEDGGTEVRLLDMNGFSPRVGDVVVARITRWPTANAIAGGQLVELLGSRDEAGVDLASVIRRYELPQEFPAEVEREAEAFGKEVPEEAWKSPSRTLFFDKRVFTIDGADAKDFDDAVSIEPLADGWRLSVHIADVSHYVREGAPLDREAYRRGTSVYFPGTVLPMLPFPLSDVLCSLRPNEIRLTLSCVMDIGRDGLVKRQHIMESAIKSARRFTYDEVEIILKDGELPGLDPEIAADVREMGRLARLLREKRFGRGSLDFDFPEPDVAVDLRGRPVDIQKRVRLEAHRLIEDFMVLANETVARFMEKEPFLYRIHETPDPARLEKLKKSLEAMGVNFSRNRDFTHPLALSAVLSSTEGTPLQPLVHLMVLRSLKQAVYAPVNRGHYGLASQCYTHFTSPIRRYPDLIVHRLVKERLRGNLRAAHWKTALQGLCDHASKRERVAVEAEREFMDIQKVRLMEAHVGKIFTGAISSVTNFGLFVELNDFFVEGLVHVTNLGHDYFIFNEARLTLVGRRTGRVFALGQKVKVRLAAANVLKRQLDFELVGEKSEDRRPHGRFHKKGRRPS